MDEFIKKLIERLKKELGNVNFEKATKKVNEPFHDGLAYAYGYSISIVNQLAEEYPTITKNENVDGWIPCSERLPEMGEFYIKNVWVTMHRKGFDFYFTRKVNWDNYYKRWEWLNGKEMADEWEVVAWMYVEVPAPYQPKGE